MCSAAVSAGARGLYMEVKTLVKKMLYDEFKRVSPNPRLEPVNLSDSVAHHINYKFDEQKDREINSAMLKYLNNRPKCVQKLIFKIPRRNNLTHKELGLRV